MSDHIPAPMPSHLSQALLNDTPQHYKLLPCLSVSSVDTNAGLLIPFDRDVKEVTEEVLRHADLELEASKYKTISFRETLLKVFQTIQVPTWTSSSLEPEHVQISKVSGALTNAVFFISYSGNAHPSSTTIPQSSAFSAPYLTHNNPSDSHTPTPCTVLLRIYGLSSSGLISRTDELRTLHILSSVHQIGPRVFGTFQGGRVEEWFDSKALTAEDLRDPTQSRWIGMRMRELHSVDIRGVVGTSWKGQESVLMDVVSWRGAAQEVLNMLKAKEDSGEIDASHIWHSAREKLDLAEFSRAWDAYWAWLQKWEDMHGRSEIVFAHNDAQYGNLLRLKKPVAKPDHHRIIVVDFEYAAPNPVAYDIANHFQEWMADYHSPDASHVLTSSRYPTRDERRNFYRGYLGLPPFDEPITALSAPTWQSSSYIAASIGSSASSTNGSDGAFTPESSPASTPTSVGQIEMEDQLDTLDAQVYGWSPASHALWVLWAIISSGDMMTIGVISEFDYLGYAVGRFGKFKRDLIERGIKW